RGMEALPTRIGTCLVLRRNAERGLVRQRNETRQTALRGLLGGAPFQFSDDDIAQRLWLDTATGLQIIQRKNALHRTIEQQHDELPPGLQITSKQSRFIELDLLQRLKLFVGFSPGVIVIAALRQKSQREGRERTILEASRSDI